MKRLVQIICGKIEKQITRRHTVVLRLESFDNPVFYWKVCEQLRRNRLLDRFVAKMATKKYEEFREQDDAAWNNALEHILQGDNESWTMRYGSPTEDWKPEKSYLDKGNAITYWRNASATFEDGTTALVLLMGTEAAPDTGGLSDTSYAITPQEIVEDIRKDCTPWLESWLRQRDLDHDTCCNVWEHFFKTVFEERNVDIFQFSNLCDALEIEEIDSEQELVEFLVRDMRGRWGIPAILDSQYVPKAESLAKEPVKLISSAVKFIDRNDRVFQKAYADKIPEKLKTFVRNNGIDVTAPFQFGDNDCDFADFQDFSACLTDFVQGKNIEPCRRRLMKADYGVVDQILGISLPKKVKEKTAPARITGEPVIAFTTMFLDAMERGGLDFSQGEITITLRLTEMKLSGCTKSSDDVYADCEDFYQQICSFAGGVFPFLSEEPIEHNRELVRFCYEDYDPFDFENYSRLKEDKVPIKTSGKWGEPCCISLALTVECGGAKKALQYRWYFSPYSAWVCAFDYLDKRLVSANKSLVPPTLLRCSNMADFLNCESEDAFCMRLEQIQADNLDSRYDSTIRRIYQGTDAWRCYTLLRQDFQDFAVKLIGHGLYHVLEELRKTVEDYTDLMKELWEHQETLTENQRAYLPLLLGCFCIASNENVLSEYSLGDAILPAWHPVVLEKLDARQKFLRRGAVEQMRAVLAGEKAGRAKERFGKYVKLAAISQGADVLLRDQQMTKMTCRSMWEYFGVYALPAETGNRIADEYGPADTEDEQEETELNAAPLAGILKRNILDYGRTFPQRLDGLRIALIDPPEVGHLVKALSSIANELKNLRNATIYLTLITINNGANVRSYIRRWLDRFFGENSALDIHVYVHNLSVKGNEDLPELNELLKNTDICFKYNILTEGSIEFSESNDEISTHEEKFPLTMIPDTVSSTSAGQRRVNISQFQFRASKYHTQACYAATPNVKKGLYRAFQVYTLQKRAQNILRTAHARCRWVVCIDRAIDKRLLKDKGAKIIGFTTGEGGYGELNVTVSAKDDLLKDIKNMLFHSLRDRFPSWEKQRCEAAAAYCMSLLSGPIDGSRVLKALNPSDYEIHNFLAYLLTHQILNLEKPDSGLVVRELISLDSYAHWFEDSGDNIRPDFMLLEIPRVPENTEGTDGKLHMHIRIIECKMGKESQVPMDKAVTQLEKGIRTLAGHWSTQDEDAMRRYWRNQLYRAVSFSPIQLDDNSPEYRAVRSRIYGILSQGAEITWDGDVYAFWLDRNEEKIDSWDCVTDVPAEMEEKGVTVQRMECHTYGQMFVQKMLLPQEERGTVSFDEALEADKPAPEADQDASEAEQVDEMEPWTADAVQPSSQDGDTVVPVQPRTGEPLTVERHVPEEGTRDPVKTSPVEPEKSIQGRAGNDRTDIAPETVPEQEVEEPAGKDGRLCPKPLQEVRLLLGTNPKTKEKFYWEFGNKQLANRHLLINGNSGCGKTYCIQGLLMEAVLQGISAIVFDYTGGFAKGKLETMFKVALNEKGKLHQRFVKKDKIPINPFAKGEIQFDEGITMPEEDSDVADNIAAIFKSVYKMGDQQRSVIYSAVMSALQKYGENMTFQNMADELKAMKGSTAKTVYSKIQTFTDFAPFTTGPTFDWGQIRDSDGMVYIFQLAGYSEDIQIILTELLLWDIWHFCVKTGNEGRPLILVMDEAQNLNHGERSPSRKILTEGRKFGIAGWYATQFMKPQLNDTEIQNLQQAAQVLYFCPPDQAVPIVAKNISLTETKLWGERLKKLKKGECVTVGSMERRGRWEKYEPCIIKVSSLEDRLKEE